MCWWNFKVLNYPIGSQEIVSNVSKQGVARLAKQASNVTSLVVVIDGKPPHLPAGPFADVADASLRLVESLVLLQGKAVGLEYPSAVSGPFLGFLEGT